MDKSYLKIALVSIALLTTTLFSGIIFGWAPLQLMLEEEGIYSSQCNEEDSTCQSQRRQFSFLYTLSSSVFMFGAFFSGVMTDYFGPMKTTIASGLSVSMGMLFLGIKYISNAVFNAHPCCAGILIGVGGSLTMLNSFPLAFVVEEEYISLVMTAVNCLFDTSGVLFLLCFLVYKHMHFSRSSIFVALAIVSAVLYGFLSILWRYFEPELNRLKNSGKMEVPVETICESVVENVLSPVNNYEEGGLELDSKFPAASSDAKNTAGCTDIMPSESGHLESLYFSPWSRLLRHPPFIFITLYASMNILKTNTYFGIVKEVLKSLGDDNKGYLYTQIFVACLPLGFVFIPVIDYIFKAHGFTGAFHSVLVLSILHGVFVLVPSLEAQVVTFLFFCAYRAFLYSLLGTYFARVFGPMNAGRLYGSMSCLSSAVNFLQYPAFVLLDVYGSGRLDYLNIALLLLIIPIFACTQFMLGPILHRYPGVDVRQRKVA